MIWNPNKILSFPPLYQIALINVHYYKSGSLQGRSRKTGDLAGVASGREEGGVSYRRLAERTEGLGMREAARTPGRSSAGPGVQGD